MSGLRGKERGGKESKRGRGQGQCVCMRELLRLEAFSDRASRGSVRWSAGSRCRGSKLFADTTLALLGAELRPPWAKETDRISFFLVDVFCN